MNKHNKSLGKRSTNTVSLSNTISNIKQSISPVIKTQSTRAHPKALKSAVEVWVRRSCRVHTTATSASPSYVLPLSTVRANAGLPIGNRIRILRMKVWNYTNTGTTTNYVRAVTAEGLMETRVSTSVEDVGCGTSLPGVDIQLPRTIASDLVSGTDALATISCSPSGSVTTTQNIVIDVHFEVKANDVA